IAFGAFAIPAGWLADHWSRYRMMVVFYFGIGVSLFLTGFATAPWQIAFGLTVTGMFAAIYHPVGIAMLVAAPKNLGMALGWNGLWGNLGLAFAAIVSGALMDLWGWRAAFFLPGLASIAAGVAFLLLVPDPGPVPKKSKTIGLHLDTRTMSHIFVILLVATACGGVIFNSTTVAMPKVFDERLRMLTETNDGIVGKYVADEYRARVLSVRYVISLGVASVAVPLIAVLHRTEGGFRNVFLVLALLACAVFVAGLFFPSRRQMAAGQAPA